MDQTSTEATETEETDLSSIISEELSREPVEAAEEAPPAEAPEKAPETPDQQAVEAPVSWSKEDRELFATLPPNVQGLIAKREQERDADYTRKTQEIADIRRFSDEVRPIIDQYQPLIAGTNVPTAQVLDQLFQAYSHSQSDPVGYVEWAINSLGVDVSELAARLSNDDQATSELRKQIEPLRQTVGGIQQRLDQDQRQREQERQDASIREARAELQSFADKKNADGTPAHPHFEKVGQRMGQLLAVDASGNSVAGTLEQAYEMAIWADPDIRKELTSAQEPKAPPRKPVNVKTTGVGPSSSEPDGSVRDTINGELARKFG